MSRTVAFVALMLAGCLVLLLVTSSRSLTAQSWQPYRGGFVSFPTSTDGPTGTVSINPASNGLGKPPVPTSSPARTPRSATPAPTGSIGTAYVGVKGVAGIATWYRYHRGQAAAAQRLRDALGPNWRGMTVNVCESVSPHRCVAVILSDYESSQIPGRLIDLDSRDFAAICGPLSKGVCDVVVTHG